MYGLFGNPATDGTALDTVLFGKYFLRENAPRSVDILPIFYVGVPNLPPYQLATGKNGNPLAAGKPFINNFLPSFGDIFRLNMAVPPTPRNSADFSSLGIVQAAVLGLTEPRFNQNANLQWIPNIARQIKKLDEYSKYQTIALSIHSRIARAESKKFSYMNASNNEDSE